jgi:hypothetical protein
LEEGKQLSCLSHSCCTQTVASFQKRSLDTVLRCRCFVIRLEPYACNLTLRTKNHIHQQHLLDVGFCLTRSRSDTLLHYSTTWVRTMGFCQVRNSVLVVLTSRHHSSGIGSSRIPTSAMKRSHLTNTPQEANIQDFLYHLPTLHLRAGWLVAARTLTRGRVLASS